MRYLPDKFHPGLDPSQSGRLRRVDPDRPGDDRIAAVVVVGNQVPQSRGGQVAEFGRHGFPQKMNGDAAVAVDLFFSNQKQQQSKTTTQHRNTPAKICTVFCVLRFAFVFFI